MVELRAGFSVVIPAKAGIQERRPWTPVLSLSEGAAGVTNRTRMALQIRADGVV